MLYIFSALVVTIALGVLAGRFFTENDEKGTGLMGVLCLAGSIGFAAILALLSMENARGTISGEQQTLVQCGLREGVVYKTEVSVPHTEYRELVVVRNESDQSHRACMIGDYGFLPDRFVVVDGEAVTVEEGSTLGDTEHEERQRRRGASYEGNFGQLQEGEPIIVTGQRPQE